MIEHYLKEIAELSKVTWTSSLLLISTDGGSVGGGCGDN
jgi:hypothetical protein